MKQTIERIQTLESIAEEATTFKRTIRLTHKQLIEKLKCSNRTNLNNLIFQFRIKNGRNAIISESGLGYKFIQQ